MGRKLQECRGLLREFVKTSTFHGLPGVVTAPTRWMRVTWIILFLIATSISLYQTAFFLDRYLKNMVEIETKVRNSCVLFWACNSYIVVVVEVVVYCLFE